MPDDTWLWHQLFKSFAMTISKTSTSARGLAFYRIEKPERSDIETLTSKYIKQIHTQIHMHRHTHRHTHRQTYLHTGCFAQVGAIICK